MKTFFWISFSLFLFFLHFWVATWDPKEPVRKKCPESELHLALGFFTLFEKKWRPALAAVLNENCNSKWELQL